MSAPPVEPPPAKRREVTDDDPAWARFWSLYPRKAGKGAARRAWARALDKASSATVLSAVERFAGSVRDVRYCPHPATWLNQERWTDEPASAMSVGEVRRDGNARVMSADEWKAEARA